MAKKNLVSSITQPITGPVDCACVIYGTAYPWEYVEKLYNMLSRNISQGIRLHVYTEKHRSVPAPMIKHELTDWKLSGPRQLWWYKMQLFNADFHKGPLLYFDLDMVITGNLDWIPQLSLNNFWCLQDFKNLWRPTHHGINSSIMWWDTSLFHSVYQGFTQQNLAHIVGRYQGDQDYLNDAIRDTRRRYFDPARIQSWRWQCIDGGYDFKNRRYRNPGFGPLLTDQTSVLVFHGKPKPVDVKDPLVLKYWQ